jgi:hypothetical protein
MKKKWCPNPKPFKKPQRPEIELIVPNKSVATHYNHDTS